MIHETCKYLPQCPLLQSNLLDEIVKEVYKKKYCHNPEKLFNCKRFLVKEYLQTQTLPEFIMPNSFLSIEEIIDKYQS